MSHTRTVLGLDADESLKENAARALVELDAASGFNKPTDPTPYPSVASIPSNTEGRRQWDREQADRPTDYCITRSTANVDAITSITFSNNNSAPTKITTCTKVQPVSTSIHRTPTAEHHVGPIARPQQHHAQTPQPHAHNPVTTMPQPNLLAGRGEQLAIAPPHPSPHPGYEYPPRPDVPRHGAAAHVARHAANAHHAHAAAAAAAHAHAAARSRQLPIHFGQQPPVSAVLMSMSSIGFGVAPAFAADATEAVIRAVQDSMERSAVRLPTVASLRQSLTIHLKLGVPPQTSGEPMYVDISRLSLFLPQSVPLLPVEVVVGGLLIGRKEIEESPMKPNGGAASQQPAICTAIACVTLQQSVPEAMDHGDGGAAVDSGLPGSVTVPSPHAGVGTWATNEQNIQFKTNLPISAALHSSQHQHHIPSVPSSSNGQGGVNETVPDAPKVHRTNSIDVLAQISGAIRERQLHASNGGTHKIPHVATAALAMVCSSEAASLEASDANYRQHRNSFSSRGSVSLDGSNPYSYKKLAPGMTPKNNKRLFVRHDYKDYSRERPLPEEQVLVRADTKTPNAAFPLKLHETLSQIEFDGYGHIIGWMHHGRSFKIHQQQEFVDVVLPRYFVMTKKSSFLRQLNLYNFNRISVGPDSGSYYHEKFLRGLKFLCRRMSRQKVNGNGIRAAGNPDDEPALADYPSCPPKADSNSSDSSMSQNDSDNPDIDPNDNRERPYNRLVGGKLSRLHSQAAQSSAMSNRLASPDNVAAERESTGGSDEVATQNNNGSWKKATAGVNKTDAASSQASFPLKLQRILDKSEAEGRSDIISWLPHGRAFLVHDVDRFVSDVMSQYFNQTKYSSFQRQLHMYNFQRITFGRDKGAYHHDHFVRNRSDLCMTMVRTRVNGKGCRRPGDPDNEPDFYVDWETMEDSPSGSSNSQTEKHGEVVGEPV